MAEEDLIFGKNRHFFGGIEPDNMKAFSATIVDGKVQIAAELPDDTIVNGQTLCSVKGAIIRRKVNTYPQDEFDGELVADISRASTITDSPTAALTNNSVYYAAFPYTTMGVYNRNRKNRAAVGGTNVAAMTVFSAESDFDSTAGTPRIRINAQLPTGVTGAIIVGNADRYPTDVLDGVQLADVKSTTSTIYDTNVLGGRTYYYSAFPYITEGVYVYNLSNRTTATAKNYVYLFGYDITNATSDPSERVTYPADVENAGFTPVARGSLDSQTLAYVFNYGDWNFEPGEKFMPRPCMLTYDGAVDHYLDPNDYAKKIDGTASSVSDTSFGGNAMMEWPKIYTKRWEENGIYHFRCSDYPQDDDWDCWCNYDRNDNQIDHFYTSIYTCCYVFDSTTKTSTFRSLSNMTYTATMSSPNFTNLANDIASIVNNGKDWYAEVLSDRLLIQDLLVMMGKSTDTQTVYGAGKAGSSNNLGYPSASNWLKNGYMNENGMFACRYNSAVKVFGMEHYWGHFGRYVAGLFVNITSGTPLFKLKLTRGVHDGSTAIDYDVTGQGYITFSLSSSTGFISQMSTNAFGRLPSEVSGSSSTYECDYYARPLSSKTLDLIPYFGVNDSSDGYTSYNGAFTISNISTSSSLHYYPIGYALSCKPSATT